MDTDYEPDAEQMNMEDSDRVETDEEYEELLDKVSCKVCMEKFDDEHPEATIIPCAHKFCFKCLSSLPQKNCPNCRARFTMKNVYKLH